MIYCDLIERKIIHHFKQHLSKENLKSITALSFVFPFPLQVYVTTTTLDGKCKDLETENADEDLGRKLSACAAWIQDQEEGAEDLEDFVNEQVGQA